MRMIVGMVRAISDYTAAEGKNDDRYECQGKKVFLFHIQLFYACWTPVKLQGLMDLGSKSPRNC